METSSTHPAGRFAASLAALALLVLADAASSPAQEPAPTPTPAAELSGAEAFEAEFEAADLDKDGRLSEEEAEKAGFFTAESFEESDTNADGQVTLFELGAALQGRLQHWLSASDKADVDGDGYVTEEEARQSGGSILDIFTRADRDRDGRIARDELDAYNRNAFYSETKDPGVVPNIIDQRF